MRRVLIGQDWGSEPICWSGIGIIEHSVAQWLQCHKNSDSDSSCFKCWCFLSVRVTPALLLGSGGCVWTEFSMY